MTFRSRIWYPISGVLSMINVAAVGYAAASAEPWHATVHAALAVAFGLGAYRLRERRGGGGGDQLSRLEAIEADLTALQQEISETQERLDFTERVLAQRAESRQVE